VGELIFLLGGTNMTAIAMTHETGTRGNDVTKSLSDRDLDRNTVGLVPQIRAGRLADTVKRQAVRETDASQRALADQRTRDSGASRDIEKAIRTNTGLDAVQNNIHTIGAQAGD
jgi:hypothetical protein